jgi:hypothetical protein
MCFRNLARGTGFGQFVRNQQEKGRGFPRVATDPNSESVSSVKIRGQFVFPKTRRGLTTINADF